MTQLDLETYPYKTPIEKAKKFARPFICHQCQKKAATWGTMVKHYRDSGHKRNTKPGCSNNISNQRNYHQHDSDGKCLSLSITQTPPAVTTSKSKKSAKRTESQSKTAAQDKVLRDELLAENIPS